MEPQSNEDVITLRVGKDLKAAFIEMTENHPFPSRRAPYHNDVTLPQTPSLYNFKSSTV